MSKISFSRAAKKRRYACGTVLVPVSVFGSREKKPVIVDCFFVAPVDGLARIRTARTVVALGSWCVADEPDGRGLFVYKTRWFDRFLVFLLCYMGETCSM